MMYSFELAVSNAVRDGQVVRYEVIPIYVGDSGIPVGITINAVGSGPDAINIQVSIPNIRMP